MRPLLEPAWIVRLTPASAAKTAGAAPAQAGDVTGGFVCCKLWLGGISAEPQSHSERQSSLRSLFSRPKAVEQPPCGSSEFNKPHVTGIGLAHLSDASLQARVFGLTLKSTDICGFAKLEELVF